jgi:hypothetical protein
MDTDPPLIRWHAVAYYRTANGSLDVHFDLEELERGPHWDVVWVRTTPAKERLRVQAANAAAATVSDVALRERCCS